MRLLPWDYGVRNLLRRPARTLLTAFGLTLVVFLMFLLVSFLRGLDHSLEQSGEPRVVMLYSLQAEDNLENSVLDANLPSMARKLLADQVVHCGTTLAISPELVTSTLVGEERPGEQAIMGSFRGVTPEVFLVRQRAFVTAGQFPQPGEALVGRLAATKLGVPASDLSIGKMLQIGKDSYRISGHFAAPGTMLEAEIWLPLESVRHLKPPSGLSLIALRLNPQGDRREQMEALDYFCENQGRNQEGEKVLRVRSEQDYYAALQGHYRPLKAMAWLMVVLVGLAGACGAVNTMYAAVAGRTREFAALQALGFPRRAILVSLCQESVLLAALGTLVAAAAAMSFLTGTALRFTMGAFELKLDAAALLVGCGAGVGLGLIGAIPPAVRALRLSIASALKAA